MTQWSSKRWISEYRKKYTQPGLDGTFKEEGPVSPSKVSTDPFGTGTWSATTGEGPWNSEYRVKYRDPGLTQSESLFENFEERDMVKIDENTSKENADHANHSLRSILYGKNRSLRKSENMSSEGETSNMSTIEGRCEIDQNSSEFENSVYKKVNKDDYETTYQCYFKDFQPRAHSSLSKLTNNPLSINFPDQEGVPYHDDINTIYREDYINHMEQETEPSFTLGKTKHGTQDNRIRPVSFGNGREIAGLSSEELHTTKIKPPLKKKEVVSRPKMIKKTIGSRSQSEKLFTGGADNVKNPEDISTIYRDNYVNFSKYEKIRKLIN